MTTTIEKPMAERTAGDVSVGVGPKGGIEYREWTGPSSYYVRKKFQVWKRLSEPQRAWATATEAHRKAAATRARVMENNWRDIMRGGR